MPDMAIVKSCERVGGLGKQVDECADAAFNQDGGGKTLRRPVGRGSGGRCVWLGGENTSPIAGLSPPVHL